MTPAELRSRLAALPGRAAAQAQGALQAGAELARVNARQRLQSTSAGPSAPGDPPVDVAGKLAASLVIAETAEGATLTATGDIARFLEFGTARMAARPFLRPAIAATAEEAHRLVAEAIKRAVTQTLEDQP